MRKGLELWIAAIIMVIGCENKNSGGVVTEKDSRKETAGKDTAGKEYKKEVDEIGKMCNGETYAVGVIYPNGFQAGCARIDENGGIEKRGFWRAWWPKSEKIAWEGEFKEGKRDGKWTFWYGENGRKWSEGRYKEGKRDGEWKSWLPSGELVYQGGYKKDAEEGEWTYWRKNGSKYEEGLYKEGKKQGAWTTWDEKGNKARLTKYDNGEEIKITR